MYTHLKRAKQQIGHHLAVIALPLSSEDSVWVKQFVLWVGSITTYLLGQQYQLLAALFVFIVLDFLMGLACAIKTKTPIESDQISSTSYKFVVYISVIIVVRLLGLHFGAYLGLSEPEKLVTGAYMFAEGISILKHADRMGFPVPALVKRAIESGSNKINQKEGGEEND